MFDKSYSSDAAIAASQSAKEREYWVEKLSGELVRSCFPYDNKESVYQVADKDRVDLCFSGELFSRLTSICNRSDIRLLTVLTAGLLMLINKYTGIPGIIVGTPIYKQKSEGNFINTVVALKCLLQEDMTFKDLLYRVKQTIEEALKHQNYPIKTLLYDLQIPFSENDSLFPLFDIVLLLKNIQDPAYVRHIPVNMKFIFFRTPQRLEVVVQYNRSLYDKETVERIIGHFSHLLKTAIFNVDLSLPEINILPEEEKKKLLEKFNHTQIGLKDTKAKTIHRLFEDQMEKTPERVAIVFVQQGQESESLTYRRLHDRTLGLAAVLKEKGIATEHIVALLIESSIHMAVAVLAVLKAGGVYLPIDMEAPEERKVFILKDSEARLVLTGAAVDTAIFPATENIEQLDVSAEGLYTPPQTAEISSIDLGLQSKPSDPAYIIYTSGSTGRPKGVIVEHSQAVNTLVSRKEEYHMTPVHTALQLFSYAFDGFITSFFTPIISGAQLVLLSNDTIEDIFKIVEIIAAFKVTHFISVPVLFQVILTNITSAEAASLQVVTLAGDKVHSRLLEMATAINKNLEVVNEYGVTEAAVMSTIYRHQEKDRRVKIGHPIRNTSIYIAKSDDHQHLVPIGVFGEMCIAGVGVARGYMNKPALTSEKFKIITYELDKKNNEKLFRRVQGGGFLKKSHPDRRRQKVYKTGDLARWLPDGNIEFDSRMDFQVKVRGFRIELGEIERQLLTHQHIKETTITASENNERDKYLCAYIVSTRPLCVSELREYLVSRLPNYMIPAYFIFMERMPLSPNGKVDRKKLPPPSTAMTIGKFAPPRDQLEKQLIEIWANVLGLEKDSIGIDADFFELGGHSLTATLMSNRIYKDLNVKVPMVEIFKAPRIRSLGEYIRAAEEESFISIRFTEEKEYYALSSAQNRFYILQQMATEAVAYNIPLVVELEGAPGKKAVENVFWRLIQRHETLRTSFNLIEGSPVQKIHEPSEIEFNIDYYNLEGKGREEKTENEAEDILSKFVKPFDLSLPPLLRVGLIKILPSRYLLMVDMHHILTDVVAYDILTNDFLSLYSGRELPPLRLQYKDYSEWRRSKAGEDTLKKQEKYWLQQFPGEIPVLNLPADFTRPVAQSFEGSIINFELSKEETTALYVFLRSQKLTLFMAVLGIFSIFLSKICNQEEIVVGTPIVGRRHAYLEKIIGVFLNMLGLRNHINEEITIIEFYKGLKDKTLEAFENQDYHYEDLVARVEIERDISRNPLFDVLFALKSSFLSEGDIIEKEMEGLKIKPHSINIKTSKFDLSLLAFEGGDQLHFSFEYCTKLFLEGTILRFVNYLKSIISSVVENPDVKISVIEIITEEEKKQILYEFNATKAVYPEDKTIHRLFEEQAERTPDQIAIIGPAIGGKTSQDVFQLTYRELNNKSERLASLLIETGVEYDTIIGIMVERSIEMIAGIIGILKSKGTYLPIDMDYPQERIDFMLKDSGASVLFTTSALVEEGEKVRRWKGEKVLLEDILKVSKSNSYPLTLSPSSTSSSAVKNLLPAACHRQLATPLAYIIYTSGTTGKPKGVLVEHRNVVNTINWFVNIHKLISGIRILQVSDYTFDASVNQIFGTLISGASLYIAAKEMRADIEKLQNFIIYHRINLINFVPSLLKELLCNVDKLKSLHTVLSGAEKLNDATKDTLIGKGYRLFNQYGPTETTIDALALECSSEKVSLGKPIFNVKIYILDKYEKVLPIGVVGELYISGAGVARGYLNRPELTSERFIFGACKLKECRNITGQANLLPTRHLTPMTNNRIYKTGDLVRWMSNGNIEYLGRIDHQVKIRGFRVELGEIEAKLSRHGDIANSVVIIIGDENENKNLSAYIVAKTKRELTVSELREYLSRELPDYMIPSYFVYLEKMPLNPGGKIDYKAFPDPREISSGDNIGYVPPVSAIEKKLVETWEKVLGRNNIGIDDNFFSIGGDSIKSIQIISRMNNSGYKLDLRDLFQYPVISNLAHRVKKLKRIPDQSIIIGVIPLTPIQERFFNQSHIDSHHYNQAVMLYSREGFDKEAIKQVFSKIQEHHDALRMTYKLNIEKGKMVQINHGLDYSLSIDEYDLRNRQNSLEELNVKLNKIQASIDLEKGPLMKLGLFHLGDSDRLLIAIHHLVIDGVSWRILFEDIETLYSQYKRGEKFALPEKTDSLKLWSEKLLGYANSNTFLKEKSYWSQLESNIIPGIPKDFETEENNVKDTRSLSFSLGEEETGLLLTGVNHAFGTEINDILLTALGLGIKKTFGHERVLLALEGHGREEILENIDISRTVGWFTSVYPILMHISYVGDLGRQVKQIKEILRRVPNKGIGYGILKYLTGEEHKNEVEFKLKPQISFNYLGQFDADVSQKSFFEIAKESLENIRSHRNRREYELDISGMIANNRLGMTFSYNEKHFKPETMAALVGNFQSELRQIIAFCASKEKREFTPSDFTYRGLSIETVNRLMGLYPDAEDIYTLTPMQEGMLFHALADEKSYSYFEQMSYRLQGELEINPMKKSLNELFKRHAILRTAFIHTDIDRPLQIVLKDRVIVFHYEDITKIGDRKQKENFVKEFKAKDKERLFDLSNDVLMRVSILQLDKSEYEFTWSFHHILMDGWCMGIINTEFLEIYNSKLENRTYRLPLVKPYRTYIQWLEKQDREASAKYWQSYLDTFTEARGIQRERIIKSKENKYKREVFSIALNKEKTRRLNKLGADHHVTLSIITQTIWGILLAKYNGKDDVVFGVVVSGRPFELEGVESMVGLFINTIPVRIRFAEEMKFIELLQKVQEEAIASEPYHYHSLAEIQSFSLLKQDLIDHIFLFDNFPIAERIEGYGSKKKAADRLSLKISNVDFFEQTNYDFNVILSGRNELSITFQYNGNVYDGEFVERICNHFRVLFDQVMENEKIEIRYLVLLSKEERQQVLFEFNNTEVVYPKDKTINHLFEEQVERTPEKIAVSSPVDSSCKFTAVSCFKKNPYIFESDLGSFKILKTNTHHSVVINKNMLKLIDVFTGENNLEAVFSILNDFKQAKFIMFTSQKKDLLGVAHEFNSPAKVFSNPNFNDFILLVQLLHKNSLVEFHGINAHTTIIDKIKPGYFQSNESFDHRTALKEVIKNHSAGLVKADVLLLGDTQGMPTTGLLYMASFLRRNGVRALCRFYDDTENFQAMAVNIERTLDQTQPQVVGISMKWFLYIARVIDMCKIIKEYSHRHGMDIKVVVGGNTASYYWEELIKYDCIDYLVRGDGEEPLLKLLRGEKNIPNCIYRENAKIIEKPITYIQDEKNSKEIYLSHLDEILPDRYTSLFGTFFVYTHKGCAMNCLYCGGCNKAQQKVFNRKNVLRRGVKEIRKDIIEIKKYASTFHFEFDIQDKNLADYCRQIWEGIELSGHFCLFNTLTLPSTELVELVSRTFKYVYWDFDICTPCERHRKQLMSLGLMKPLPTDAEIMAFMATCENFKNIEVRPNLITGLPYFTAEDFEPGEKLLLEIMSSFSCFGELHWARLHAQPGAPILENAEQLQMNSLATSFEHFLEYSKKNFYRDSGYVSVEDFNYPYIYFKDDLLNSRITNFYLEINRRINQYKNDRLNDTIALETLTYRHLNQRTDRLAETLVARGVRPGDIVGLMLERSLYIPTGILAVLKCGAAYLPIDPEFPGERIKYMLKDTNASALVTMQDLIEKSNKIISWEGEKILLEPGYCPGRGEVSSPIKIQAASHLQSATIITSSLTLTSTYQVSPANLAYVIYTSGTTGKPKGVAIKHENLVNYVYWFSNKTGLTDRDKTILTTSFAFDLGYTSLYNSLLNGCELHILPREIYLLAERLLDYIRQKRITYIKMTPSLFSVIVNSPNFSAKTCKSLRVAAIGGEAINVTDIEKVYNLCSHIRIMNHYGPTEAAIGCIATFIDYDKFDEYKRHPVIGKPIYNTSIYILDKYLNLLPVGVPGELCISGTCLAIGYLNQPELTAEKFDHDLWDYQYYHDEKQKVPGKNHMQSCNYASMQYHSHYPITPPPHSPTYRTGDLARWLPNRTIEFLGRIDNQVKIRGYRIEVGEIENWLLKHGKIENALVLVSEAPSAGESDLNKSGDSNKYLCAYIVPKEKGKNKGTEPFKEKSTPGRFKEEYPNNIVEFVRRFQELVKKKQDKIAVKSDNRELTYGLMDKYAGRVAREILQKYDDTYSLSKKERQRYKRQMLLYGWGLESQEKLKSATVFVAGAGGGGSPTIVQLALLGFGTIKICDFDEIELSNLNRQFLHNEQRIGMNKALSAKITVKQTNPHVNVITFKEKLTRENVFELVGDSAVIFDMLDGPADKFILSECAVVKQIPHIIIAMADLNSYSAVFHTPHTPCYHCIFDKQKFETITAGMQQYVENYRENPLAVASPSLFTSTGTAVTEALKVLLGFDQPAYNKFFYFNQRGAGGSLKYTASYQSMTHLFSEHFREISKKQGLDWEEGWRGKFLEELDIKPNPDCPVCGSRGQEKRKALEERMKKAKPTPILVDVNEETAIREKNKNRDKKKTVALLLNHDIQLAVGITAALKSGKTCVPFDPLTPIDNLSEMLTDSEARIILTDNNHLNLAEKLKDKVNKNIKVIEVGLLDEPGVPGGGSPGKSHELEIEMDPEQEAYILNSPDADTNPGFNKAARELQRAIVKGNGPYVFTYNNYKQSPGNAGNTLTTQLREYLLDELPGYMIPSYFIQLEKIPMTPNGKVDKKALPTPALEAGNRLHRVHKPRNEIEEQLAQIWSEVLGIEKDKIGIDANFFELGGHSLNATIMVTKIHKKLNVKLPLREVFMAPTIRGLAEINKTKEENIYALIQPIEEREYYPVSSAQLRLFLLSQIKTNITSDNMSGVFSLYGHLEGQFIEDVFNQLIKRHEVFRISFELINHQPVQRINRAVSFKITYIEPDNVTSTLTDREISNIIKNFIQPFDLSKAPLFRIGLLKLVDQKHLIMYDMHHIISDGTSFPIFVNEFISLYGGEQLPPLRIQYKDFTHWQNNLVKSNALKKQEEYWLDLFSTEIPDLKLPTDYPREALQDFEGDFVHFLLGQNLTAAIYKIVNEVGATLYMALLAIYNILLYKYTGQEDIVVGSSAAGRPHVDLQNVLGFFVNTLPMRNYPKGEKTFIEFLTEVKSNALKAYDNQDFQFDELVRRLGIQRDASRQVLFDTHFTLHKIHVARNPNVKIENLGYEHYPFEEKATQFDIIFHASETEHGVHFIVRYSKKLFKKKTIQRFLDYYKEIAQIAADNKNIMLKDIKISHHLEAAQPNMPQADFVF